MLPATPQPTHAHAFAYSWSPGRPLEFRDGLAALGILGHVVLPIWLCIGLLDYAAHQRTPALGADA